MRHVWCYGVAGLLVLTACQKTADVTIVGDPGLSSRATGLLPGTWSRVQNVVGSRFTMTLAIRDTVVSGTGTYAIEAGRSGTLTVRGAVGTTAITLDYAFDYGDQAHFHGAVDANGQLIGSIKYGPAAGMQPEQAVSYRHQ